MMRIYGRTQKAVIETICICKDKNILKEYLSKHESEVVDIMMSLFDKEQILTAYIEEERQDAREEGHVELAKKLLENGFDASGIAATLGMTLDEFQKWMQRKSQ